MSSATADGSDQPVLFRRGKKRKTYRQRGENNDDEADNATTSTTTAHVDAVDKSLDIQKPKEDSADSEGRDTSGGDRGGIDDGATKETDEEDSLSVAEVLRLRNSRRAKLRGVELRADVGPPKEEVALADAGEEEMAMVVGGIAPPAAVSTEKISGGVGKRFAPQTGLVGELVNRHMLVSRLSTHRSLLFLPPDPQSPRYPAHSRPLPPNAHADQAGRNM